ncbi:SgcJ/EcaC family oxidoreductase [Streptomyces sp. NPDC088745]|uniref:SgcJ/EcaC family oxidoreductase n=1 Tax=Streptomyces sp. NPDC088745 TaxID=3365884 RepID=UPI00380DC702
MTNDTLVVGDIPADTQAAVIRVVKDLQDAFNAHDGDALAAQFGVRASWTNAVGRRLDGREEIAEFSGPALKGFLGDVYARYDVVKLLAVADGVVGVNVHQTPTDSAGNSVEGPQGVTTYVIARQEDGWKIVVGQNSAVDAPPAA